MKRPEINWDKLFSLAFIDATSESALALPLREFIINLVNETYEAGKHEGRFEVLTEGSARTAMLAGAAYWLDAAQTSDGEVGRVVARVVAQAFTERADLLRASPKPTLDEPAVRDLDELSDELGPPPEVTGWLREDEIPYANGLRDVT